MIDNYDSFTYNLVQYLEALGKDVTTARNDAISISDIERLSPTHIIISPGPGRPVDAGITLDLIEKFMHRVPILGVCLGHQAIAQVFGARIVHAQRIMHGKTSQIHHHEQDLYASIPNPFTATRYHSLIVDHNELPDCLDVTAWCNNTNGDREIMGLQHRTLPIAGVQFHPESILTQNGDTLLTNFLSFNL